jgi:hypothetical protein
MVSERCSDEVVMSDYMVFGRRVFGMVRRRNVRGLRRSRVGCVLWVGVVTMMEDRLKGKSRVEEEVEER